MQQQESQFARETAGLKVLALQGGNLPGVITRDRPVTGLQDLRGLRLRAPTELLTVLRELGADPVNMPMSEVYSALAKGVIDGVIAPLDTFRSLHFAEVTKFYTHMRIPRGAYPSRAMGQARWESLSAAHREVLERAIPVWERALAELNEQALHAGHELAKKEGIREQTISAADQQQFDALYLADAERSAESLRRYGIDGKRVFDLARASVGAQGGVHCRATQ
jgi:TRAP-type transport system periplasmic protein